MQVLMVITAADRLKLRDGGTKKTGCWAEEVVVPHELFCHAGVEVAIATPGGRPGPVDEASLTPEMNCGRTDVVAHYQEYLDCVGLKHPLVLEELTEEKLEAYDAIFLPGGHGPMADLVASEELGDIVRWMQVSGKPVVAVCHGLAGLLPAVREDGHWAFEGYRLTACTNQEEKDVGLADNVPFLLENRLREVGAAFLPGPAWQPHLVCDRNLITGQNPGSSAGVARVALTRLSVAA
jgi:putative intracellular protease/amidase